VRYQVNSLSEVTPDTELVLKVMLDGQLVDELSLLSADELKLGRNEGALDYVPSSGWHKGIYTFQAELRGNDRLSGTTVEKEIEVTPESAAKVVSWVTLGGIIGAMLIVIIGTVLVILHRRREMLRGYI